jgi:hypothetical protein
MTVVCTSLVVHSSTNRLTWRIMQGRWGYRRVLAAFGSAYLLPNGEPAKLALCNLPESRRLQHQLVGYTTANPEPNTIRCQQSWSCAGCRSAAPPQQPQLLLAPCHTFRLLLYLSGELDRVALGQLVFSDAAARRRLNAATHMPVAVGLMLQLLGYWLKHVPYVVRQAQGSKQSQIAAEIGPTHSCRTCLCSVLCFRGGYAF